MTFFLLRATTNGANGFTPFGFSTNKDAPEQIKAQWLSARQQRERDGKKKNHTAQQASYRKRVCFWINIRGTERRQNMRWAQERLKTGPTYSSWWRKSYCTLSKPKQGPCAALHYSLLKDLNTDKRRKQPCCNLDPFLLEELLFIWILPTRWSSIARETAIPIMKTEDDNIFLLCWNTFDIDLLLPGCSCSITIDQLGFFFLSLSLAKLTSDRWLSLSDFLCLGASHL